MSQKHQTKTQTGLNDAEIAELNNQFATFTDKIRPKLSMDELQAVAAFAEFLKSKDENKIPGNDGTKTNAEKARDACAAAASCMQKSMLMGKQPETAEA